MNKAAPLACRCQACLGPTAGDPWALCANQMTLECVPAAAPAPIRKAAKHVRRFTMVPGVWEELLGQARASGSTYAVAVVLLYEAKLLKARGYAPNVKLTDVMLKRVHVGRRGKRVALQRLSALKLVSVEYRSNRNPIVTVHFIE